MAAIQLQHGNCKHKIIMDYIDLTPDQSETIYYCEQCFQSFTIESIYKDIRDSMTDKGNNQCIQVYKNGIRLIIQSVYRDRTRLWCQTTADEFPIQLRLVDLV
jgi:hypothetical protein